MTEIEYMVVAHEDEDGGFSTDVLSLPGTGSRGATLEEAIANTKEGIVLMIEYLREKNEPVPEPREQVIKVTVAA